ncbi:MAG: hypothetical protein KDC42_02185 [Ignavibacteriae bacterium]|nr:hypothetical protein [Ignavibacteriota bacterium]
MEEVIIQTKIIPEKDTSRLLPRPQLVDLLKKNAGKQLIVISAGAGYGKTTLVKQFIDSAGISYCWYKIDETDSSLFTFLTYLIGSISNSVEGFGESSSVILDSIKNRNGASPVSVINTVCGTVVNELSKSVNEDFYIIFDDLHLLPDENWVQDVMQYLLNYLPKNIHIIITTRKKEQFDTGKLKAKRKYFEITDELKFSPEEVSRLAQMEYDVDIKEEDTPFVGKFGGWITGLHMFLQTNREKAFELLKQDVLPENLYDYFAEDIFNSERGDVQDFLLMSSVLDNFTAKECDKIFNRKDSAKILDELSQRNVFIQRADSAKDGKIEQIYNYQPLFKNFLMNKSIQNIDPVNRKGNFKKIADHYSKEREPVKAIKYLLLAEEYEEALKQIMDYIDESGRKANIHLAEKWVKSFPEEIMVTNPDMLFYRGWLKKNLDGDYKSALEFFNKALGLNSNVTGNLFRIKKYIVEVLVGTGKIEDAEKIIASVLKEDLLPDEKATFLYWYGVVLSNLSKFNDAIIKFEQALEIVNVEDITGIKYSILNELGNIHLIKGDYTKAAFYYESVISNSINVYNKFQTINNIVQVYAYEGSFLKADEFLKEAEEFVSTYPSQFFKVNYLLSSAYLKFMLCDYERSVSVWEELLAISIKSKIPYYTYVGNLNLGICFFYVKDFTKSEGYFCLAEELSRDMDEGEKIYLQYWKTVLAKEANLSEFNGKDLEKAVEYYTKMNMMYERVHSLYHLADFYLKSGNEKMALEFLDKALTEGIERKYITIFQKEFLFKRALFDLASEKKLHRDFLEHLISSLFELAEIREEDILTGVYDIRLQTFGEIKLEIRGTDIPDDKWVRKIRKLIFIYILLSKKMITKDSLIDLFYPDSDPENATSIFHQTLSNIRSIIKWAIKGDKKDKSLVPEFVIYEGQRITLNTDFIYYIDAFEFEKLYTRATGQDVKDKEKIILFEKAISLYKGEFLEGYYQPWCEELRERYTNYYISILEEMVQIYRNLGKTDKIVEYSELLLKADNLNEGVYLDLIKAHLESKQHDKAKSVYDSMINTFKKELGEEPSAEIKKQIEKLIDIHST